ncbi:MAG: hypothetical protein ACJ75J_15955 [Cytophagaceae bacterium]
MSETIPETSVREIYFQLFKTPEEFKAIDLSSQEVVERGLSQKELITKLISRLKKEKALANECKAYFLNAEKKLITSRLFVNRKYSRFKRSARAFEQN